jgi:putative spermidine/putrescine transport system permease protein
MLSIALPKIGTTDRWEGLRPLALAAPLLLLLLFSFGAPIVALLSRAVYEPTIANALPHTIAALRQDSGVSVPGEPVFLALAADLKQAQAAGAVYEFAKALNTRLPGAGSGDGQGGDDQGGAAAGRRAKLGGDPHRH